MADWTFLVYLDADSNLEGEAIYDFLDMAVTGSSDDVNIVVQMDPYYSCAYGGWDYTRRGLVEQSDEPDGTWGSDIGEVNMGDPAVLESFIEWGVGTYPAEKYALVLWDHGDALGEEAGICWDWTSDDYLTLGEISDALDAAGTHFDLISLNACLMSFTEAAYEIGDYADVMEASQDLVYFPGWDYDTIVAELVNHPEWGPEELGTSIATSCSGAVTQSVVDLIEMQSTGIALGNCLQGFAAEVRLSATTSDLQHIETCRQSSPYYYYGEYRDLGVFLESVAADESITTSIREAAEAACTAYEEAIIYNIADPRPGYAGDPSGLSIYLPVYDTGTFDVWDYRDKAPTFCQETYWDEFLVWWDGGVWDDIIPDSPRVMKVEMGNASEMVAVATGTDNTQLIPADINYADRVQITFSRPIDDDNLDILRNALAVYGRASGGWEPAVNVSLNVFDHKIVTWTFAGGPYKSGEMIMRLSDAIISDQIFSGGYALDGEWTSPENFEDDEDNSTFAGGQTSGNETPGGDFIFSFTMPQTRLGDADCDGVVEEDDAAIVAANWLQGPGMDWTEGDFNGDGYVNETDNTILASNWGTHVWPSQAPTASAPIAFDLIFAVATGGELDGLLFGYPQGRSTGVTYELVGDALAAMAA